MLVGFSKVAGQAKVQEYTVHIGALQYKYETGWGNIKYSVTLPSSLFNPKISSLIRITKMSGES